MIMKTEITKVTPTMAETWLKESTQTNRRISKDRVSYYARSMKAGHWKLNGSTITFDTKENVLDGQHRLLAVIEANRNVDMLVVKGVESETMPTIDTGRSRKLSDVLAIRGEVNTAALGSSLAMLNGYVTGQFGVGGMTFVDNDSFLELLERHPKLIEAVAEGRKIAKKLGSVPRSIITGVYLTRMANPQLAADFENGLTTGAELKLGDARLALMKIGRQQIKRNRGDRMRAIEHLGLYIKAWNAWVKGDEIHVLRFGREENMPRVLKADGKTLRIY